MAVKSFFQLHARLKCHPVVGEISGQEALVPHQDYLLMIDIYQYDCVEIVGHI